MVRDAALGFSLLGFWLLGALFPAMTGTCYCQTQEADVQWELAEHLLRKGEPYRAITEYERFLFYFPSDPKAGLAQVRIVEAYVAGRWWADGARAAQEALGRPDLSQELRARLLELLGLCLMRMGRPEAALRHFELAMETWDNPVSRGRIRLLMAELNASLGDWDGARQALNSVEPASGLEARAWRGVQGIPREGASQERSPWMAGALAAILPGAGHAYLGRWEDAALVLSVNAAFLGATVEAIQRREPALAGGMALAELLWYSGNVFSAVSNTHKHNRLLRDRWAEGIRVPQAPLLEGPQGSAPLQGKGP